MQKDERLNTLCWRIYSARFSQSHVWGGTSSQHYSLSQIFDVRV